MCNLVFRAFPGDSTEVSAQWEKLFDFYGPDSGVPRTYEKTLVRFWIHYEAIGEALWRVEAFNRRGQPVSEQLLKLPPLSDGSVRIAAADLAITDDVIKVRFTLQCGVASIIYMIADIEPKGQTRKDT